MKTAYAIVAGALLSSSAAFANVVYDEAVDGDLIPFPTTAIMLAKGVNIVGGSSSLFGTDDFDSFAIEIPVGHALTSIILEVTAVEINAGVVGASHELYKGIGDKGGFIASMGGSLFPELHSSSYFEEFLPLSEGQYTLLNRGLGCAGCSSSIWNYSWTLTVTGPDTEVPEPAALALFGLGLAGLGLRRRKGSR